MIDISYTPSSDHVALAEKAAELLRFAEAAGCDEAAIERIRARVRQRQVEEETGRVST
jgi:hypothetical protein